jgi:hypothetical protein
MRRGEPSRRSPTQSYRLPITRSEATAVHDQTLRQIPVSFGNSGYVIQYRV